MPDWITHILLAFVLADLLGQRKSLVLIGAVLPDVLIAPFVLFRGAPELAYAFYSIFHTPFASLTLAASASSAFKKQWKAFSLLALGVASHFALDIFQAPGGYQLLWPLSTAGFGFDLFYSDSLFLPAAVLALFIAYLAAKKFLGKKYSLNEQAQI